MSGNRRSTDTEHLHRRAHELIPAGAHTYSKGDDQFPESAPRFITRGFGSRVWDSDGNEYLDWGMGLRSVLLGHAYPEVIRAAQTQLVLGQNFVRPSPLEVALAERLVELIPAAEMVKFAKNGSDVTTAAIRLARAATGRSKFLICQDHPFFSVDDWFIGSTVMDAGVPESTRSLAHKFRYNDLASLQDAFTAAGEDVAAVILEPMGFEDPAPGYLEGVRRLTKEKGAVLIFDEMITGFRFDLRGAQHLFGVTPDLATFGKALGNGFAISALVGRRDIMELGGLDHKARRVFLLSTTNGGETHALAAALAAIGRYEALDVAAAVDHIGALLRDGISSAIAASGLNGVVSVEGRSCSPTLRFQETTSASSAGLRTLFMQEMLAGNVLMPYIAPSFSHTQLDIEQTVESARVALGVCARAVDSGLAGLLVGPEVRPVFRRYN
jgi:glutamate-1-semialdehyde 2,1-aminomutase